MFAKLAKLVSCYSLEQFSNFRTHQNHLKGLLKQITGPTPRAPNSANLGCMSNTFPGDASSAGSRSFAAFAQRHVLESPSCCQPSAHGALQPSLHQTPRPPHRAEAHPTQTRSWRSFLPEGVAPTTAEGRARSRKSPSQGFPARDSDLISLGWELRGSFVF